MVYNLFESLQVCVLRIIRSCTNAASELAYLQTKSMQTTARCRYNYGSWNTTKRTHS